MAEFDAKSTEQITGDLSLSMQRILVLNVDDHEPGRYARTRLLKGAGYAVAEAGTGREALALVAELRPSVILLDVQLPDISGLEVCRRIRADPQSGNTPILQISASAVSEEQRATGLDNGADAYLVDPVDSDVLLATVRALLRIRRAEQELHRVNEALLESNAALQGANAALQRSNEGLQRFSYIASHDLQEPLRSIRSFATLISRRYGSSMDSVMAEYLGHIESASARMSLLIRDLLAYAQAGEQDSVELKSVNIEGVIEATLANLEQSLQECSAQVVRAPMPVVVGHEGQLIQLFQNLVENALKYRIPDKSPVISVSSEKQPDGQWLFSVHDNGVGIAPENLEIIFDAFKRLHGREVPGTGIGLATCRRIVERHGGRIRAESGGTGSGATFLFTLPETPGNSEPPG